MQSAESRALVVVAGGRSERMPDRNHDKKGREAMGINFER